MSRQPAHPHHPPLHRVQQLAAPGLDQGEPVPGPGDAGVDQLTGKDRAGGVGEQQGGVGER